jgi:hypothetical protein
VSVECGRWQLLHSQSAGLASRGEASCTSSASASCRDYAWQIDGRLTVCRVRRVKTDGPPRVLGQSVSSASVPFRWAVLLHKVPAIIWTGIPCV